ncbi:LysR substrate-binding domain-containing protein [Pseudomonadota bacterium]
MLNHQGLHEFVAVVEQGGFTAASNVLGVSTSFVSRQVRRLEDRLEIRLLHRTTRAVQPTEMGRIYYERSREILDQLGALESDIADLQKKPQGLVRITAPGLYAERFVAPVVAEFSKMYPEVNIYLDTRMGVVDIVGENFDLAVRMSALDDSSMIARKIVSRRLLVCASPAYFDKYGRPEKPDDLRAHNCLKLTDLAWRFAYPDGIRAMKVRGSWISDSGRALREAAIQGIGMIRITDYYLEHELHRGELEVVLEDYEVKDTATWIVYPERHHLTTRVRYLIEFLAERLRT